MSSVVDVVVLSLSSFLGNVGVALTGFGMAIVYLFVWQIAVLSGYDSDFKYAVFIQALALFSAQPLLLHKAEVREFASRKMLLYFIPITILSTPLGQITGDRVSTDLVEAIGGVLVTFVAVFEIYQKRTLFAAWFCRYSCCLYKNKTQVNTNSITTGEGIDESTSSSGASIVGEPFSAGFDLGKKLGEGAFSVVREGIHKRSGKVFAVKIVNKAKLLEQEEERLKDEIALMQELRHSNIICLYEVYDEPESYLLVTEKMAGGDLVDRLNKVSFFNERQSRKLCESILQAVSFMHSKKIAHRDLKPENLLLDSDRDNDATVKLADFGFAKREEKVDSFTTMCGTYAYVAPEVLKVLPYGLSADMWSIGVIVYIFLAGYQPFRGQDDNELKLKIMEGSFEFDDKFWKNISKEAKDFIASLLVADPSERLSAKAALASPWFSTKDLGQTSAPQEDDTPVFFMIGSQRSGSNWLRTMLDEREDLVGPHPPHMMRDFTLVIEKFGELSDDDNFRVLVDHVCTFVERNQVPWTDKHGAHIVFPRAAIHAIATDSCNRVRLARAEKGDNSTLESGFYLLSVFDAIMNFFTRANGKRLWMCKSMGMSKFHDLLLEFYGEKRLRYIYLVRDPRDVAMSFMKTPVGDCHYHAIVTKWTNLQGHALKIVNNNPELVHKVHYESILQDKESVVKGVYDFIGERRFGGVKRQASVLFMNPTVDLINGAKNGREAAKAQTLSYQFQNLGRGQSFAKTQNKKWADPVTGLKVADIQLLESVAHEMMGKLGYETHLVGVSTDATEFTEDDLKTFKESNKAAIQKMNDDLQEENPGDFERRKCQAEALSFSPFLLTVWDESDGDMTSSAHDSFYESSSSPDLDLESRRETLDQYKGQLQSGRVFRSGTATQRGYYPFESEKPNQDASKSQVGIAHEAGLHWFSVFDGHGPEGHQCADFATENIPRIFVSEVSGGRDVKTALERAHLTTHQNLLASTVIDSSQSGTTAVTLLLENDTCFISNVGDSACILGSSANGINTGKRLCSEHTPFRADERERIKRAGGLIMTVEQRDGLTPVNESWNENCDHPRIWSSKKDDKFPGCGFTRSIGDSIAHSLGVTARPEVFEHTLEKSDRVLIVASDGITEFMDNDLCVEIACRFEDPTEAALALIDESSKRWIDQGDYMDDITAIVIFLDGHQATGIKDDIEAGQVVATGDVTDTMDEKLGFSAQFWTLFAGAASGFLGGLCGIRGPPIILYFLHPPYPVSFTKKTQRATGACITFTNVAMRLAYYLVNTLAFDGEDYFEKDDWGLYVSIIIFSLLGVLVGSKLFEYMKDSKATIRGILAMFLLLCGISLLLSSFADV